MGLLYLYSYLNNTKYYPKSIEDLENLLVKKINDKGNYMILDTNLANFLHDILLKLGFMCLAKDNLMKTKLTEQDLIQNHYDFHNFVYDTKALLDSISMMLNHFYKLGSKGGTIDLSKDTFLNELDKKNSVLFEQIKKQKKWINEVVDWRLKLIHRLSTLVAPFKTANDPPGKVSLMVTTQPEPLFSLKKFVDNGGKSQEVIPLCQEWIKESEIIFENICESLIRDFKSYISQK